MRLGWTPENASTGWLTTMRGGQKAKQKWVAIGCKECGGCASLTIYGSVAPEAFHAWLQKACGTPVDGVLWFCAWRLGVWHQVFHTCLPVGVALFLGAKTFLSLCAWRLVVWLPSVSHLFASWRWSFLEAKTFQFEIGMTLINVQWVKNLRAFSISTVSFWMLWVLLESLNFAEMKKSCYVIPKLVMLEMHFETPLIKFYLENSNGWSIVWHCGCNWSCHSCCSDYRPTAVCLSRMRTYHLYQLQDNINLVRR